MSGLKDQLANMLGLELLLLLGGALLVAIACGFLVLGILGDARGLVRVYWMKYTLSLERKLRSMFIWVPGKRIAIGQLLACVVFFALYVAVKMPFWYFFVVLALIIPPLYIEQLRKERVNKLESQLVDFLMALANALKSVPSVPAAFISVEPVMRSPLKEEVQLSIKEMKVGSTLEQALVNMASRVNSRNLDASLSTVLIGKQIGGDLPTILERTASTMREMERLEGVVRTKTAEGKAQLWVLAAFPLVLIFGFNVVQPGYFDPLSHSFGGYLVATLAAAFWLASLVVAAKVLAVDI